jgi:hypothetical protein
MILSFSDKREKATNGQTTTPPVCLGGVFQVENEKWSEILLVE